MPPPHPLLRAPRSLRIPVLPPVVPTLITTSLHIPPATLTRPSTPPTTRLRALLPAGYGSKVKPRENESFRSRPPLRPVLKRSHSAPQSTAHKPSTSLLPPRLPRRVSWSTTNRVRVYEGDSYSDSYSSAHSHFQLPARTDKSIKAAPKPIPVQVAVVFKQPIYDDGFEKEAMPKFPVGFVASGEMLPQLTPMRPPPPRPNRISRSCGVTVGKAGGWENGAGVVVGS